MGIAHYIVYLLFRAAWFMAGLVPRQFLQRALEAAGAALIRLDSRHRTVIEENLDRAFPDMAADKKAALALDAIRCWARIVAELVHERDFIGDADLADLTNLHEAIEANIEKTGRLIILTAHTGNFEVMPRLWGRSSKRPLGVFHRPMKNPYMDAFLTAERRSANYFAFERGAGIKRALRWIDEGGIFMVPLDQNQALGRGVFVPMFGELANTTTQLARLALALNAVVLPVFAAWEGERLVAVTHEPIVLTPEQKGARGDARRTVLQELTAAYTREIEEAVRRYPAQWNWAHRRWKTRPPTEIS